MHDEVTNYYPTLISWANYWLPVIKFTAGITTIVGFVLGVYQLWRSAEQARTTFEDTLNKEYRELMRSIPYKALLGEEITEIEIIASKEAIYNHLDFCNQQVFLRQKKRIRFNTWTEWQSGMKSNFSLPIFKQTAAEVFDKLPGIYKELRLVQKTEFCTDPALWKNNDWHDCSSCNCE